MVLKVHLIQFKAIFILILLPSSLQEANYDLVLTSIECLSYGNYTKSVSCTFVQNPSPRLNIDIQLHKLVEDLRIDFIVHLERPKMKNLLLFKSSGLKFCDILKKRINNPVLKVYKEILEKAGDLPEQCPIPADYRFKFLNVSIDTDNLPPYAAGEAAFNVVIISKDKKFTFLHSTTRGRVVLRKKIKISAKGVKKT